MNEIKPDQFESVYESETIKKLKDYYKSSLDKVDYYDALVNFIACPKSNNYSYAKLKADEVLHRQGKNRKSFDTTSYKLSKYYEGAQTLSENLDDAFSEIIQQFVILSNISLKDAESNNNSAGIKFEKSCMKTLMVLIFNANLYEILNKVDLPRYLTNSVNNLLTTISQSRTNIFNEYKQSLIDKGYENLIGIVDKVGMDEFFEKGGSKSIEMFNRFFKSKFDEIGSVDSESYKDLLAHYESYKNIYHSMYDELNIKYIIPFFNNSDNPFSKGIYDSRKSYVISKLNTIAENLGDNSSLNRLIYHEN